MRKYFSWDKEVRKVVRNYINDKVLSEMSYEESRQEPNYVAGIFSRLKGTAYDGEYGKITFKSTIVDDRGKNAAQKFSGADFAIRATMTSEDGTQRKAVIGQAKRGDATQLSEGELKKLLEQIQKMKEYTKAPIVFSTPEHPDDVPRVYSGNKIFYRENPKGFEFADYVVRRILPCIDGDMNEDFFNAVGDSSLKDLHLIVERSEDGE